jgi:hypothetical protein
MKRIAEAFVARGYVLRSGHAAGADRFFEAGAGAHAELYRPSGSEGHTAAGARILVPAGPLFDRAVLLASVVHPAWGKCNEYARLLHSRNVFQIHGERLDDPVRFVVAWAPPKGHDDVEGGTGMAWRIARAAGIPRFNLAVPGDLDRFRAFSASLRG